MTDSGKEALGEHVDRRQCRDTGMALVLICLLITFFSHNNHFVTLAIFFLLVNMTFPGIYTPFARLWFGLSILMGTAVSKVVLSVIFFMIVTPVGLIRSMTGSDAMKLKKWKNGTSSVFNERNYLFRPEDIERPF